MKLAYEACEKRLFFKLIEYDVVMKKTGKGSKGGINCKILYAGNKIYTGNINNIQLIGNM